MLNRFFAIVFLLALGIISGLCAASALAGDVDGAASDRFFAKKLIQFGWDMQSPTDLAVNINQMQDMPFDGITIRAPYGYTFYQRTIDEASVQKDIDTLSEIDWGRFDHNFFYFVTDLNVDWFDDDAWGPDGHILRNIGYVARAAHAAGCVGLLFDPEFIYWGNSYGPFRYQVQPSADEKSFAEMADMAQERGNQFMTRIQKEFPNPVILNLFWATHGFLKARNEYDPENRNAVLRQNKYGLLPAFMSGMLQAASPDTIFVEGNEPSYYYNNADQYFRSFHDIHQGNQALLPEELRYKYRAQVQCGQAIYADYLCNTFPTHLTSTYMTPEERMRWMEHNVYWALTSSDRYVWFYNERMEWLSGRNIPDGLVKAVESARHKVASNEPLGFEISEFAGRAWRELRQAENRSIEPKEAAIPHMSANQHPPTIDGILDDSVWQQAVTLEPFENYAVARIKELQGATQAYMICDDRYLYVGFQCNEPTMADVKGTTFRDQFHDGGDRVEIAVMAHDNPGKYYHLVVDCDNNRWDSLTEVGKEIYGSDSSWVGDFQSAPSRSSQGWSVEIALPWQSIGIDSPIGAMQLKGNLMRRSHRRPSGVHEFSSWSESRKARYVEADHFGIWMIQMAENSD